MCARWSSPDRLGRRLDTDMVTGFVLAHQIKPTPGSMIAVESISISYGATDKNTLIVQFDGGLAGGSTNSYPSTNS
eukprot:7013972-Prymnesium_polylepis.1